MLSFPVLYTFPVAVYSYEHTVHSCQKSQNRSDLTESVAGVGVDFALPETQEQWLWILDECCYHCFLW